MRHSGTPHIIPVLRALISLCALVCLQIISEDPDDETLDDMRAKAKKARVA